MRIAGILWAGVAAAFVAAAPVQQARADAGPSQARLEFRAVVPSRCELELRPGYYPVAGGLIDLGQVQESCNAPSGYRVVVRHGQAPAGARLVVDGVEAPLTGFVTVLSESRGPQIRTRRVQLRVPNGTAAVPSLSFAIETR